MAYDKVVDSAQLDAALTATANAIREKAGNADACAWDASTGFASLIAAIQAGGNFAYGTVTAAADNTSFAITHNLGVVPQYGVWCKIEGSESSKRGEVVSVSQGSDGKGLRIYRASSGSLSVSAASNSMTDTTGTYYLYAATATTIKSPKYVIAGNSYRWFVVG